MNPGAKEIDGKASGASNMQAHRAQMELKGLKEGRSEPSHGGLRGRSSLRKIFWPSETPRFVEFYGIKEKNNCEKELVN